jgi:hypothetical protein
MRLAVSAHTLFIGKLLTLLLCVPFAIVAVGAIPIDDAMRSTLLPLLLLILVWPLAGMVSLIWGARLVAMRLWGRAALAFGLAAFIAISLMPFGSVLSDAIMEPAFHLNQLLHFLTMKHVYDEAVQTLQGPKPHLKLFVWEMDPIGGSGVVYDERDAITLPKSRRPKNWSAGEKRYPATLDELCRTEPMGRHYYIVSFGC